MENERKMQILDEGIDFDKEGIRFCCFNVYSFII